MTHDDLEALSRLLEGDLPANQAEHLMERMTREPALAAQWERMQEVPVLVDQWADERVPVGLHESILDRVEPSSAPAARSGMGWTTRWWLPLATAAIGLWMGRITAPAPVVEQVVSGNADVVLHGARLTVDGTSSIRMEPKPVFGRVSGANVEGDPMKAQTVLAAGAGMLLTLTVQQGTAALTPTDATQPTTRLAAPDATLSKRSTPRTQHRVRQPEVATSPTDPSVDPVAFENAVLRGQLAASEGQPQPWPTNVAAPLKPQALQDALEAHLGDRGEIIEADCEEYPCVHMVAFDPAELDGTATDELDGLMEAMSAGYWEGGRVPNVFVSNLTDSEGRQRLIAGVAVQTNEDLENADLQQRLEVRGSRLLDEARERVPFR